MAEKHQAVIDETQSGALPPDIARVVLGGLQWQAKVLAPRDYGDKLAAEHSGPDGGAIPFETVVRKVVDPKGEK